jgi:hypothetical protein
MYDGVRYYFHIKERGVEVLKDNNNNINNNNKQQPEK